MNESSRTATFVGVALVSVVLAWFLKPAVDITPDQLAQAKMGQLFFPDFTDPNEPTSIRVITFDEARAASKPFGVEFKNGLWTIPSHHNYPADGKDRLSKTATSALGIKREELRSISKDDQEELGVVDPLDEDSSRLKGRGQRVTLSKGDAVLADFIIGKQVRDRPGFYYVRVPTEDSTYVAKLDINLSTKFADWVETDLLKLSRDALRQMVMDNYSISTEGGRARIVKGEINQLDRTGPSDPWKLEGIDEKTEELDNTKVADLVGALDDLKLVGVRPKPKGLRADLTIDRQFVDPKDPLSVQVLVGDLRARGFEVGPDRDDPEQPRLYSRQGETNASTNDGVVYVLRFGEIFTGDESEIEIGGDKADQAADEGDGSKGDEGKAAGKQSSRYLFVSTQFDEKQLGPRPVEPERPAGLPEEPKKEEEEEVKPEIKPGKTGSSGKKVEDCGPSGSPGVDDEEKNDEEKNDEEKDSDEPSDADADAPRDNDAAPKAEPGAEKEPAAESKPPEGDALKDGEKKKSLDELKKEYETLRQKYDADLSAYENKVKAGKEKVEELNQRFGEWYYVISAENFNKLHLSRKDLVKSKAGAADAKGSESPAGKPAATDEKSPDEKSDDNQATEADKAEDADKE